MITTAEPPFSEEEIQRYHFSIIEQIVPFPIQNRVPMLRPQIYYLPSRQSFAEELFPVKFELSQLLRTAGGGS